MKQYLGEGFEIFCVFSGFVGVYLAGYILELSGSWAAVFNVTAVINMVGIAVYLVYGSGQPIL